MTLLMHYILKNIIINSGTVNLGFWANHAS